MPILHVERLRGDAEEAETYQALTGAEASEALFAQAAEIALAGAQPLRHNAYKLPLVKSLVRRALQTLAAPAP
jgi:xanthine dehydrogenase YagS FAD-binding subunit